MNPTTHMHKKKKTTTTYRPAHSTTLVCASAKKRGNTELLCITDVKAVSLSPHLCLPTTPLLSIPCSFFFFEIMAVAAKFKSCSSLSLSILMV
jgi:hypothetical protein